METSMREVAREIMLEQIKQDIAHESRINQEGLVDLIAITLMEDYELDYSQGERWARQYIKEMYNDVCDQAEEEIRDEQDTWDSWTYDYSQAIKFTR